MKKSIFTESMKIISRHKETVEKLGKEKKERLKYISDNFKGEKLTEENASVEKWYREELSKLKQSGKDALIECYSQELDTCNAKVKSFDEKTAQTIETLKAFEGLAITKTEFEIIANNYSGNYWIDKALSSLATKNGLEFLETSANIDTQIEILETLKKSVFDFIESCDSVDFDNYKTLVSVSDKSIIELERNYSNNYNTLRLTPMEKAKRVLAESKSQNDLLQRANFLSNAFISANDTEKKHILMELDADTTTKEIVASAKLTKYIDDFKQNGMESLKRAYKTVDNAMKCETEKDVSDLLKLESDNIYMGIALESVLESATDTFKMGVTHSGIVEVNYNGVTML